ncbi:MAG: beta-galactosidase, partial [Brachybacterium tyrofermentans]
MTASIDLTSGRLALDGVPSVVLCSSVFPFRIPSEQWDHRLQLVQESGYGMVDLYVHWGFHEEVPGVIDLESPERDLRRFLDLAHARGLLVMARPGPYICSETDGGGLPWWLHGDHEQAPTALRTTDPAYLAAVDRWFGAVMPILADAQVTRGGPVALVQIENELDFFDCPDPDAYMTHLAERTRALGIEVPIIGCAGQGELAGATGDADGVVPTVNLYPSDASRTFDEEARHYASTLEERGLPLMVTETNRLHRTLRREILAGARLVAPYLQTSGFDHLVLPSAGNWGDPGSLMTHDYDFDGYISPDGRRRPEYDEAIALAATLGAWGDRLATATPVPLAEVAIDGIATGGALALPDGGFVVGPAELTGLDTPVRLRPAESQGTAGGADGAGATDSVGAADGADGSRGQRATGALVLASTCPFWAIDVPLDSWGAEGTLVVATAELVEVDRAEDALVLTFEGGPTAVVKLLLPTAGGRAERLRHDGVGETSTLEAARCVRIIVRERGASRADPEPAFQSAAGRMLPLGDVLERSGTRQETAATATMLPGAEALDLPDGRLQIDLDLSAEAGEVLLLGAADLVRLELDGADQGVHVTHGAPIRLPLARGSVHRLRVVAEIWGRANFDDARRPALQLGAGRGAGTVLEVHDVCDVTDLWEVRRLPDRRSTGVGQGEEGALLAPPLRGLGGWSSPNLGGDTVYGRSLPRPDAGALGALRLHGLTHPVHVSVDGGAEQLVAPEAPILLLGEEQGQEQEQGQRQELEQGTTVDVAIRAPHVPEGLLERAELLTAIRPTVRQVQTLRESELAVLVTESAR